MSTIPVRCDDVRDDLDAYALGVLDRDDARRFDEHVAACPDCRRLLDEARESAAALALSVPMTSAGPAVRARVLDRAAVADVSPIAEPRRMSTSRQMPNRGTPNRWWLAAAAVLVAALAGVSAWAADTQRRIDHLERDNESVRASATAQAGDLAAAQAALADVTASNASVEATLATQRAMVDVMAQPDVVRIGLHGTRSATSASAQYVWSPARAAGVMLADRLPLLAEGQIYQAWVVYETSWESAGTFSVDASGSGTLLVSAHEDGTRGAPSWYCVTVEPAGGSPKHSGTMVLSSLD